jgi:hypothetical protein
MRKRIFAAVVVVLAMGSAAAAHHSYSAYHLDQLLEFEGNVESLEWANPHSMLKVRIGATTYLFEWAAPNGLTRQGIEPDTLKAGDRLVLKGNPHREMAQNGVVRLRSIVRPSDGWNWPAPGRW